MELGRWKNFSKRDQLGHIASELARVKTAGDKELCRALLEKALALVDLTMEDSKWRADGLLLLNLRQEIASAYESGLRAKAEEIYAAI